MKVRTDFVTNSSSSSFIIVAGKVLDEARCREWCNSLGFDPREYDIIDLKNKANRWNYNYDEKKNVVTVDSFMGNDVRIENCKPTDKVFIYDYTGNEGDMAFMASDDSDIDYDIDLGFFEDRQNDMYKQANKTEVSGLTDVDTTYGAGRNG